MSPIDPKKFEEGASFSPSYSGYERPMSPYVCGRGATWGRPCAHGANPDATCGGTTECAPFKKGDRWECRRPASSGGPCPEGPKPDGHCSHTHAPCAPLPSLRTARGRVAKIAVGAVIALIAGFLNFHTGQMMSLDPGPLSHKHQNFVRKNPNNPADRGCVACHAPHEQGALGWLKAAFQPAGQTSQCIHCHKFGTERDDEAGRRRSEQLARTAHNNDSADFGGKSGVMKTECTMCHQEHQGARASLVKIGDAQCRTCHMASRQFESFANGHPAFPENFPHTDDKSYWFNHEKHFKTHFRTRKALAPSSCTNCHNISGAERAVKPSSFAKMCSSCHTDTISKPDDSERDLVLINMPKLDYGELPEDQRPMVAPASPAPEASPAAEEKKDDAPKGDSAGDSKKAKEELEARRSALRVKQALSDNKAKDLEARTNLLGEKKKAADEKKVEADKLRKEADERKAAVQNGGAAPAASPPPDASPSAEGSPSPDASPAEEKKGRKGRRGRKEKKPDEKKSAAPQADTKELEEAFKKADEAATKAEAEARNAATEVEPLQKAADEAKTAADGAKEEATKAASEVKDAEENVAKADGKKPGTDAEKKPDAEKPKAAAAPPAMVAATCPSEMESVPEAMAFVLGINAGDAKAYNQPVFEFLKELTNTEATDEGTALDKKLREQLAKQNKLVLAALDAEVKPAAGDAKRTKLVSVLKDTLDTEGMEIAEKILTQVDKEHPDKPDSKIDEAWKKWFGDDAERTKQELSRLTRGLSREALLYAASNWVKSSKECEAASGVKVGTWYTDGFTLKYKAAGHADPVVRTWIEWAIVSERLARRAAAAARGADADAAKLDLTNATALRDKFTKNDGPAQCLKCHVLERTGSGDALQQHITWPFNRADRSPHFHFAHAPHLSFLVQKEGVAAKVDPVLAADKPADAKGAPKVDPWKTEGCVTCHTMLEGMTVGQDPKSNFKSIKKDTCLECHNVRQVRQDCQLCHRYHKDRGFTSQFRLDFRKRLEDRAGTEPGASPAAGAPASPAAGAQASPAPSAAPASPANK